MYSPCSAHCQCADLPCGEIDGTPVHGANFIDHMGVERHAYQSTLMLDWNVGSYTLAGLFGKSSNQWGAVTETYNRPDPNYFRLVYLPYDFTNSSAELRTTSPAERRFEFMLTDSLRGFLRGDYVYTGRQYATAANLAYTAAAQRLNLRAGVRTDRYTIEVYGLNVTGDDTPSNILRNANPNGSAAQGLNLVILAAHSIPSMIQERGFGRDFKF